MTERPSMNTQLEAAHAAVPEIADHHRRRALTAELLDQLPSTDSPEREAQRVADVAVEEYLASGVWPDDVEERAQEAYARAAGAHAVRSRLSTLHRDFIDSDPLKALREAHRTEILASLGSQLDDLLTEARKHTTALGPVRTADEALAAGGDAATAYTALRALVPVLTNIRAAQWTTLGLGEVAGPRSLLQRAKDSGFGDVQGISDDTPAEQFRAMQERAYTLDHLVWLAQMNGVAYVPESVEDVIAAQDAYEQRDAEPAPAPVVLEVREVPNVPAPQPRAPRPVHERKRVAQSREHRSY
ncbi:hypothetical protein [Streptomyces niveus]|uniref:Uncharacterized protein n=1 Tax=Streptomyces niveus TaxID=193462 RepID=A0ABZ2ABD2_STRNV|nr:hypothetical protein [Streptomyces niveus]